MNDIKDLIIIGAGPAGLTAAIYGNRAGLDLVVIEKLSPGGQVMNTFEVENYPGFVEPIAGWDLMAKMEDQARRLGTEIVTGEVFSIEKNTESGVFSIKLADGVMFSKAVILASGANFRKLDIPGENEFLGKGVSYCATCDGAFYKDRITAVVGGGDVALEEALFLTRFSNRVYLIHRRDQFRGSRILQDRVLSNEKIIPVYDSVVESINGPGKVKTLTLKNKKTSEISSLETDGIFIFIGYDANTSYVSSELLNENREVIVDMKMKTSVDGLFAAGDLRCDSGRQIVMAASDGATAAMNAYEYISNL